MKTKKQHQPAYPSVVPQKWVFLIDSAHWSMRKVAREYYVSVKTVHTWYHRTKYGKQYVPKKVQPATKLTGEIKRFIEYEKKKANPGPLKLSLMIKRQYGVTVFSTIVYRYLKKKGLIRRPQKRLPWYTPLKTPVVPQRPGELVQCDIKYVWQEGKRKYQRTFVDVYTGIPFAHIGTSKDDDTTILAFKQAVRYFPFRIDGMQTDNGGEFRGTFHQYLVSEGIAHYFIPKKSPQWNGCVERLHRSMDEEYYLNPNKTSFPTLNSYLKWYRYERISLSKNLYGLTPQEKLLECA
jgi:transposase